MNIIAPFIKELRKIIYPKVEVCNSFGGYAIEDNAIILLCDKKRGHKGEHDYGHTPNLGWRPIPKILVLAENHRHFIHWCKISGLDPRKVHYINDVRDIYGVDPDSIFIFYETWRNRSDANELMRAVTSRKAQTKRI